MVLSKDFKEFLQSLNDHKVRYLVVGGHAVALYGYPRYTKDLDVWIQPTKNNLQKLLQALKEFGFGSLRLTEKDFKDPEQIIQLGYPPNRIDIMTDLIGVEFRQCYDSKKEVKIGTTVIKFIDLKNLKKNKRALGRHQDLADLENLD
jgi:hypothetical protein